MHLIGKILKTKGIKGEILIRISPHILNTQSLHKSGAFLLKSRRSEENKQVQYSKEYKGDLLVKFENVDSIDKAYRLIGNSVFLNEIDVKSADQLPLTGYTVLDIDNQDVYGTVAGEVKMHLNKLIEIEVSDGSIQYIPRCSEFIKTIDVKNQKVFVKLPNGLLDLN